MLQYAVFLGALIQFLGGAAYVRDTLRGETQPNRVTWLLWTVAPFIGTAAAISNGVGWAILPVFMAGFVPFLVFISSFVNKQAYWKLGTFDYACGSFSILALALWILTKDPIIAIFFAILADLLAALPTLVKAWAHPETETGWPYSTTIIGALLGFLVVKSWDFSEYAFSAYLILICSAILFAIYRRRFMK